MTRLIACNQPVQANCDTCTVRSRALFGNIEDKNVRWTQGYRDKHRHIKMGDVIFHELETINYAFTLYSGCLILYKTSISGEMQILRIALPGDFIGFKRNSKSQAVYGVQAATDARICCFSDTTIKTMVKEQLPIAQRLIDLQSHESVLCQEYLFNLGQKSAKESIAYLLMDLYTRIKIQTPEYFDKESGIVHFPINQDDISSASGLTKVHVSRIITAFRNEKLIECGHKKLKIINESTMSEIAEFNIDLIKNPFSHFS